MTHVSTLLVTASRHVVAGAVRIATRLGGLAPGLAVLLVASPLAVAQATAKSDLSVLLVTHDPEAPDVDFPGVVTERTHELYRERAAAFEALLHEHFEDVRTVYAPDYTVELSELADVTLFDAKPRQLSARQRLVDPDTGATTWVPERYLPDDFDHAALMIAEMSPRLGEALGSKLDWL